MCRRAQTCIQTTSQEHCFVTCVPGYVLQVPQVLLLWSVSHPITLLCQAMFCKYHKCYFSEVYHIVSHYCSREHCFVTCVPGYVLQVPQVLLLWSVSYRITLLFSGTLFCHLCARLCSASTTSVTSLKCTTSYHTTVLRNTVLSLVCQAMFCKYHKCYFSEVYHNLSHYCSQEHCFVTCVPGYVLQVPQVLLLWSVSHPMFCKYHKCYFSEVYHILSHYCGSFQYANKLFKSVEQFLLRVWWSDLQISEKNLKFASPYIIIQFK